MKAGFMTLGCRVNQYETEALAERLESMGVTRGEFTDFCDIYVINTCAVTEESVRKSRQMVRRTKKRNPSAFVGVMGCASQLDTAAFSAMEGIAFVCGTRNKEEMEKAIAAFCSGLSDSRCSVSVREPEGALLPTCAAHFERARAYVKIEDGCNGRCSYCVIPSLRGRVVIREEEEILREVERIAANGCREVVLTGIETAAYGKGLPRLIERIDGIDGICRIRMGSLEPSFLREELIDGLAASRALCRHFHLSVQSGSDSVLSRMRRKYNTATMERNIACIRQKLPGVNFSADVIVGFPGESEEEFEQTCRFVRRVGFLHLHIFPYSRRLGTEAAQMPDQIPDSVKSERLHRLETIAAEEKHRILTRMLEEGESVEVLIESCERGEMTGHTGNFAECRIPVSDSDKGAACRGTLLRVKPERIDGGLMICRIAEEAGRYRG